MNDRRTDFNFPVIDLTNNNACNSNALNRYLDLIRNDDINNNRRTELTNIQGLYSNAPVMDLTQDNDQFLNNGIPFIDLTQDNDQFLNNGIPFIDLTQDNDQFLNSKIPIIDLTDDPVQDIAAQIQCINLTDDETSNHNYTNLNISSFNDTHTNASRELIDLTEDNNEDSNTYIPTVDLSNTNGQIRNFGISIFGIDRNISDVDLSCNKDYNSDRPVIGLMRKCDNGIRNPAEIELHNDKSTSFNNFPASLQKTVAESSLRTATDNFCDDVTENNVLKYNKTFDKNLMHIGTSRRMQQCCYKEEIVLPNPHLTNNFEGKKSCPSRSEKIRQNTTPNFMKPAGHPIPLRHSLGRSTVNTSKNVPIEFPEDSEGHSRTLTVSSIIRRKKTKSSEDISKEHLPNSSEPPTSKAKTFSFDDFKEFFQKLWSLLFYWIFKVIILRFIEFYNK